MTISIETISTEYYIDNSIDYCIDYYIDYYTECITPFDFFFWPVKCIKTKKIDIKLHLFSSLVTTISLSGTNLNRNTFFDLLFES